MFSILGKENVWLHIVNKFKKRVWIEPYRRQALACTKEYLEHKSLFSHQSVFDLIVDNEDEAVFHIVNMGTINYQVC